MEEDQFGAPFNPAGGMIIRKRSGTSHGQKGSFKGAQGSGQFTEDLGGAGLAASGSTFEQNGYQPKVKGKLQNLYANGGPANIEQQISELPVEFQQYDQWQRPPSR